MRIAIAGLGRMGSQIAQKLLEGGHDVVTHNRSHEPIVAAVKHGAVAAYQKQDVITAFHGSPVILWLMLPADIIDKEIISWLELLPRGSTIIDGGNSDYRNDVRRAELVASAGCHLLDVGTSGGVWGYTNGFSMMIGGNQAAYRQIIPALDTLAAPHGGHRYFGLNGAGHYVKMIHNAIEYGMMQSLAEGYQMLKEGPYPTLDLAQAGDVWQESSVVTSWLNDLARQTLRENPNLDNVSGVVAESGETRWTLEAAAKLGIPMPATQASFDVRIASQNGNINFSTKLLAAMRNKFGGHNINGQQ